MKAAGETGFETLTCYQLSLKLFEAAYRLAARLPDYERYNLADQLRRAALSVLLNIDEGYGRYHYLDKLRFFYIARGSLLESHSALIAAHAAKYVSDEELSWWRARCSEAEKALNGYINFVRRQQQGGAEYGHQGVNESSPSYETTLDTEALLSAQSAESRYLIPDSRSPDSHQESPN